VTEILNRFPGSARRFEQLRENLISDYAHAPAEIAATLEKARDTVRAALTPDASVSDKLAVERRLGEIEQNLQNTGVSLGDFDTANEFCTVQFAMTELGAPRHYSLLTRLNRAAQETLPVYGLLALAFLGLSAAVFLLSMSGLLVGRMVRN
jgi:hypothetical protein